jgi:hypothetical protein
MTTSETSETSGEATPHGVPASPSPRGDGDWSRRRLRIYLSDHRGGAAGGLALARRSAARNRGTPLGVELAHIAEEIEQDVRALDHVAELLAVRTSALKRAAGAIGERIARLKPNGELRGYSPLSRLLEIEGLLAGIDAKRSLWRALAATNDHGLQDAGVDLDELASRAKDQRRRLAEHHRPAARSALVERAPLHAAPAGERGDPGDGAGGQHGSP